MNKYSAKIYLNGDDWSVYIVSDDGLGAPITVNATKETIDPDIYALGWKAYAEDKMPKGWDVKVISL